MSKRADLLKEAIGPFPGGRGGGGGGGGGGGYRGVRAPVSPHDPRMFDFVP